MVAFSTSQKEGMWVGKMEDCAHPIQSQVTSSDHAETAGTSVGRNFSIHLDPMLASIDPEPAVFTEVLEMPDADLVQDDIEMFYQSQLPHRPDHVPQAMGCSHEAMDYSSFQAPQAQQTTDMGMTLSQVHMDTSTHQGWW